MKKISAEQAAFSRMLQHVKANKEHYIHGAEIAGLGTLAVPSVKNLTKKKHEDESEEEKKERRMAKYETAGLGILAVPSAIHLGHLAFNKMKKANVRVNPSAVLSGRAGFKTDFGGTAKPVPALTQTKDVNPLRNLTPELLRKMRAQGQTTITPATLTKR